MICTGQTTEINNRRKTHDWIMPKRISGTDTAYRKMIPVLHKYAIFDALAKTEGTYTVFRKISASAFCKSAKRPTGKITDLFKLGRLPMAYYKSGSRRYHFSTLWTGCGFRQYHRCTAVGRLPYRKASDSGKRTNHQRDKAGILSGYFIPKTARITWKNCGS